MTVYLFRENMDVGGLEMLMCRMAAWYLKKGIRCIVVYKNMSDMLMEMFDKQGIESEKVQMWNYSNWAPLFERDETNTVIVFGFNELLEIEYQKKKASCSIKTILYITHPQVLLCGMHHKDGFIRTIEKNYYKYMVERYLKNGNIIFMDRDGVITTEQAYHIEIDSPMIQLLPMDIIKCDTDKIRDRNKQLENRFHILSIARAEFPFKGYLLGLLKDFIVAADADERLELTIISYGQDIEQLYNIYENANESIKSRIHIVGKTDNDMLCTYYYNAHVFVGMGTTVLEAANYELPVIVARYYTRDFMTEGFFAEHPEEVVVREEGKAGFEYILKLLKNSKEDYLKQCIESKRALEDNYSADNIMRNITDCKIENTNCPLNVLEKGIYRLYIFFASVIRKKNNEKNKK